MPQCRTSSPAETAALAFRLGEKIPSGTVLCLEGDLGAGKTLFVQHLARAMGVTDEVTSPTFNLMNVYKGRMTICHFDLYRLESDLELEEIGFYEYAEDPEGLVVIEWPDKFPDALPEDHIYMKIERTAGDPEERNITFSLRGTKDEVLYKERDGICQF